MLLPTTLDTFQGYTEVKKVLTSNAKQFDYVVVCGIFRPVGRNKSAYLFMPNYQIPESVNADN